jgi:hypothetical protein
MVDLSFESHFVILLNGVLRSVALDPGPDPRIQAYLIP